MNVRENTLNDNQIYLGDCEELIQKLENESVDLCYFEPTYCNGNRYVDEDGRKKFDNTGGNFEFIKHFLSHVLYQLKPKMKKTGLLYIHADDRFVHELKLQCDNHFGSENFRNTFLWLHSRIRVEKGKKYNPKDFVKVHDTILRYSMSDDYCHNILDEFNLDYIQFRNCAYYDTDVPLKLLDHIVKASSNPGDLVLDPMMGSGTACVAAAQNNRRFIGIEIDPFEFKEAERNINELGFRTH